MPKILNVIGREILDSRGNPTVEAEVHTENGYFGLASVPSGSSVGSKESLELRDNDCNRFLGKGVRKSVDVINILIRSALLNIDVTQQEIIDRVMIDLDGTNNKSKLGSNSILSVSLAAAKAAANFMNIPLYAYISKLYGVSDYFSIPMPMMNIINGGKHADNNLDIQEFMIIPIGAKTITKAIQMGSEILSSLKFVLKNNRISTNLGDEGGYAPDLLSHVNALDIIKESVEKSQYIFGKDVVLAIDCAASELFNSSTNQYYIKSEKAYFTSKEFTNYLSLLINKYPIVSIEDGQSEYDWDGFLYQTKTLGSRIQLVGDDLFVTNPDLLNIGIQKNIANSILIKPNQIGSLTETLNVIKIAKKSGYSTVISHRSGETEDTSIVDLAVGTSAGQIKIGPVRCTERTSKYNRLIRISEILGDNTKLCGIEVIKNMSHITCV